jgi:hypothetical protein
MTLARFHKVAEAEETRRRSKTKWFRHYYCRNQGGMCYRQKLTWSIWAKKRAAIKMGFEDNHD